MDRFHVEACPNFVVRAEEELPGLRYAQRLLAVVQDQVGSGERDPAITFGNALSDLESGDAATGRLCLALRERVKRGVTRRPNANETTATTRGTKR